MPCRNGTGFSDKIQDETLTDDGPFTLRIQYLRRPHPNTSGKVYLLDLDNTLHRAGERILPEIHRQMTKYMVESLNLPPEESNRLRATFWHRYGSTLMGLMKHYTVNPHHFLAETHRFCDLKTWSSRHGSVPHRLNKLDGLRVLLTNAPRAYAVDLCKALGLYKYFHVVLTIEDMVTHGVWRPKPAAVLWPQLKTQLKAKRLVLVDDTQGHLHQAAKHGIAGVWITLPQLGFKRTALKGKVRQRIHHFEQIRRTRF
jgi:putative hydrolase of the HAD superfamily